MIRWLVFFASATKKILSVSTSSIFYESLIIKHFFLKLILFNVEHLIYTFFTSLSSLSDSEIKYINIIGLWTNLRPKRLWAFFIASSKDWKTWLLMRNLLSSNVTHCSFIFISTVTWPSKWLTTTIKNKKNLRKDCMYCLIQLNNQ